jgi:hypothetical protein
LKASGPRGSVTYVSIRPKSDDTPSGTASFTAAVNVRVTFDALPFGHVDGDGPRFGAMIGLVAVVVAAVILVFFGIGYALGRLFL